MRNRVHQRNSVLTTKHMSHAAQNIPQTTNTQEHTHYVPFMAACERMRLHATNCGPWDAPCHSNFAGSCMIMLRHKASPAMIRPSQTALTERLYCRNMAEVPRQDEVADARTCVLLILPRSTDLKNMGVVFSARPNQSHQWMARTCHPCLHVVADCSAATCLSIWRRCDATSGTPLNDGNAFTSMSSHSWLPSS